LTLSGAYSVTATQNDGAGNTGTSGAKAISIDTSAPVVTLTTVNGTAQTFPYTTGQTITSVAGACGTAIGDNPTVSVAVTGAGTQSGTAPCTSGARTFTFATALSTTGAYAVTATQTDTVGNTGTSGAKTINVDNTVPIVSLTRVNGTARTFPYFSNVAVTSV